jgi:hypothetical protein
MRQQRGMPEERSISTSPPITRDGSKQQVEADALWYTSVMSTVFMRGDTYWTHIVAPLWHFKSVACACTSRVSPPKRDELKLTNHA